MLQVVKLKEQKIKGLIASHGETAKRTCGFSNKFKLKRKRKEFKNNKKKLED